MNKENRIFKRGKLMRADIKFEKEIEDIINQRIKCGIDNVKTRKGTRRITEAIRRHNLFPKIKQDIIINKLEKSEYDL